MTYKAEKSYKVKGPDYTLHCVTLRRANGVWIGDVALVYNDEERWGCLYTNTDYGNYTYKWSAVPRKPTTGFEDFLAMLDPDYLVDKLSQGHDEARVYDAEETAKALSERILSNCKDEDAEYLGEALISLRHVETEWELWDWQAKHQALVEPEDLDIRKCRGGFLRGYQAVVIPALQGYLREVLGRETA